jgi:hypothetical protein
LIGKVGIQNYLQSQVGELAWCSFKRWLLLIRLGATAASGSQHKHW